MTVDDWSSRPDGDPAGESATPEPDSDAGSITSVGEASVIRDKPPAIERGALIAGRYQVEAVIGKGGSGVVLRAFDRTAQAAVALKVLKPELTHDPKWSRRFARELRLGRPIRHPNVCRIFDIGEADGYKFLSMELAEGGTLRDLIKSGEPLRALDQRLSDAAALITGLAAIHAAGIVHRDVKPDNLLRMEDGRLAISDFGLATDLPDATTVSVFVGTPHYMAPEVRTGEPATTRSDVWALGVVLHEIFFGKRPERKSSKSSEGISRPPGPLTATAIERAMRALCERCLADNPYDRPADATEVERLFQLAQRSPAAFLRPHRRKLALLVAAGVAVAGGLGWRTWRHRRVKVHGPPALSALPIVGQAADWRAGRPLAELPGRIYCFSAVGSRTVRVIWGEPRRAEEIDVVSGARAPAPLVDEAFRFGCPDLSPSGDRLLYSAHASSGASEVRLSSNARGSDAVPVTSGGEPVWLDDGEQFIYSIDAYHIAVFSLRTMTFSLVPDAERGQHQLLTQTVASRRADLFAALVWREDGSTAVTLYEASGLGAPRTFSVPGAARIYFDSLERLQVALDHDPSSGHAVLTYLDQRVPNLRRLGVYPGFDLVRADRLRDGAEVAVVRRRASDAWWYGPGQKRRLTSAGDVLSAAALSNGELLVGRQESDGALTIWRRGSDGKSRRVSQGPLDVLPDVSADGRRWTYVDYARKRLMVCTFEPETCEPLREDDHLPTWPRLSPDGKKLAYVTQAGAQRVRVVSLADGSEQEMGATLAQCPPVWSASNALWIFEGSAGHYFWSERALDSARATGRRIEVPGATNDANQDSDEQRCWPLAGTEGGAPFPKVRIEIEELTRLVRVSSLEPPTGD